MLSPLGEIFSTRHIKLFFLFFVKTGFDISCMKRQILFSGKSKKLSSSSFELAQRAVKVKQDDHDGPILLT